MQPADFALPAAALTPEDSDGVSKVDLVLEHYDREQLPLRRYLIFLGADVETAREIVQECFLRLHEHLLRGGDQSQLRAWLYRVGHNLLRNTQSAFHSAKTDRFADAGELNSLAAKEKSVEEDLLEKELVAAFHQAMGQLSTAQKDCLILRAQGLKYREIADVLKLSVSTVAENVQRGLDRLKESM
jgi:RNA polymerase sigma-70 factor (ECF subfamily)